MDLNHTRNKRILGYKFHLVILCLLGAAVFTDSGTPVLSRLAQLHARGTTSFYADVCGERLQFSRPFVTLAYAQSIDGSIANANKTPMLISSPESMLMTHQLRSVHDAILVGINTVQSDNPKLNVRLCQGKNPQPIVLDSTLKINETCNLISSPSCVRPILATLKPGYVDQQYVARKSKLKGLGCIVLECKATTQGRIDFWSLLLQLSKRNISSIMVEGGGAVLSSFLQSRLVDYVVVTISPTFVGGLNLFYTERPSMTRKLRWKDIIRVLAGQLLSALHGPPAFKPGQSTEDEPSGAWMPTKLRDPSSLQLGCDVIIYGEATAADERGPGPSRGSPPSTPP